MHRCLEVSSFHETYWNLLKPDETRWNQMKPTKNLQVFFYPACTAQFFDSLGSLSEVLIRTWLKAQRQKNTKTIAWNQCSQFNSAWITDYTRIWLPLMCNKYSTLCCQDHLSWHADHGCAPMANLAKLWQFLGFEQRLLLYACLVPWQTLGTIDPLPKSQAMSFKCFWWMSDGILSN